MTTQYLALDVCIKAARADNDIWMRKIVPLSFTPADGQRIRLAVMQEGDEPCLAEHEVTLDNLYYSCAENHWVHEWTDDDVLEYIRLHNLSNKADVILYYEQLGFTRITFPQGQALRQQEPQ